MSGIGYLTSTRKYLTVSALVGFIAYVAIFTYAYKGDLSKFAYIITHGYPINAAVAFSLRIAACIIHATTWFVIIYPLRRVNYIKILSITGVALFLEVLVPIGGVTEVAKVLLATKLGSLLMEEAIATLLIHRVLTSLSMVMAMVMSLLAIKASLAMYLVLLISAISLLGMNIGLCFIPASKSVERILNKILNKYGGKYREWLGQDFNGLSRTYSEKLAGISKAVPYVLMAFTLTVLERLIGGFYGKSVGLLIGMHITLPISILTFDSINAILWLLPIITPAQLGIYEFIQTGMLLHLGIDPSEAATMSIISRIIYILGGYVTFAVSITLLGLSSRGLIAEVTKYLANRGK